MSGDDSEITRAADREILKYAVMRTITCPITGVVLDIRKSVLLTFKRADGTTAKSECVDGAHYDAVRESMTEKLATLGWTVDVIDGRQINGRKGKAKGKSA